MTNSQGVGWHAFHLATLLSVVQALPNIVSVPDLHGDYDRAIQILQAAGVIDASSSWIGGTTSLVQTGDIADRGPDSLKILKLFSRLAPQAAEQGGEVVNLLGNHELMNIQGDLRYVNKDELSSVGGKSGWQALWQSGSELGDQVRKFKTAVKVGPVLFVHAGLSPSYLQGGHSLEDVNSDMAAALSQNGSPESRSLRDLLGDAGPVWTRFFADGGRSQEVCDVVSQVLKQVGAERMVVGHTIQTRAGGERRVNPVCEGSLILADTGISRAYGGEMSYITYSSGNEAVVHYPALGDEEVLPRSHLTPKRNLRLMQASEPSGVATFPLSQSEAPGIYAWIMIAQSTHSLFYISVACMLLLVIFYVMLLRPMTQRKKQRFT